MLNSQNKHKDNKLYELLIQKIMIVIIYQQLYHPPFLLHSDLQRFLRHAAELPRHPRETGRTSSVSFILCINTFFNCQSLQTAPFTTCEPPQLGSLNTFQLSLTPSSMSLSSEQVAHVFFSSLY